MKNSGFTLAETLISLVVVGVVVALAIPNMIVKHQKKETVIRLKKAYSVLSQTTSRAIADYGPIKTWEIGVENNAESAKKFHMKYVIPYLVISKPPTDKYEGKWVKEFKYLNNQSGNYADSYIRFYLNDGTSVSSYVHSQNYVYCYIDINGDRKPNKFGRDIFLFLYELNTGKFRPIGASAARSYLLSNSTFQCNKNQLGETCSAVIMKDGWQIKDDYPW